jgi:hypothetical protein
LVIAFAFSLLVHILSLVDIAPRTLRSTSSNLNISITPSIEKSTKENIQNITANRKTEHTQSTRMPPFDSSALIPSKTVLIGSESLDMPLQLENDLNIEALEDLSTDTSGKAELNLLVAEDGKVRWITVESNELPELVLNQLVGKFQKAQFSPPKASGLPTWVLIRMEISVGSNHADDNSFGNGKETPSFTPRD